MIGSSRPEYKYVRVSSFLKGEKGVMVKIWSRSFRRYPLELAPKGYVPMWNRQSSTQHPLSVSYFIPREFIRENFEMIPREGQDYSFLILHKYLSDLASKSFQWWEFYISLGGNLDSVNPPCDFSNTKFLTLKPQNEDSPMSGNFTYIVASSAGKGLLSVSAKPVKHVDMESAKAEATRLARQASDSMSTTVKYVVLKVVATIDVAPINELTF